MSMFVVKLTYIKIACASGVACLIIKPTSWKSWELNDHCSMNQAPFQIPDQRDRENEGSRYFVGQHMSQRADHPVA
jgi:hypothetical protein